MITAACEAHLAKVIAPRFLAKIIETQFNYPIDFSGKWHGKNYRFLTRYRSRFLASNGEEFDAPFARLEWTSHNRFDLSYYRHTEEWWPLDRGLTLEKALAEIGRGELLVPF